MQTATADLPAAVQHRETACTVVLTAPGGAPLAHRAVTVEQVSHSFGFANNGFDFIELANGESGTGPRIFGGARHSFTVWGSQDYDVTADRESWEGLLTFLDETF